MSLYFSLELLDVGLQLSNVRFISLLFFAFSVLKPLIVEFRCTWRHIVLLILEILVHFLQWSYLVLKGLIFLFERAYLVLKNLLLYKLFGRIAWGCVFISLMWRIMLEERHGKLYCCLRGTRGWRLSFPRAYLLVEKVLFPDQRLSACVVNQWFLGGMLYSYKVLQLLLLIAKMHIQLNYLSIFFIKSHLKIFYELAHWPHLLRQVVCCRPDL